MPHALLAAAVLAASMIMSATPVTYTTIARGASSHIESERRAEARTAAEWAKLWQEHSGETKPPAVDFRKEMVVGIFGGTQPSAGYGVTIHRMDARDGHLSVEYRLVRPKPDEMVAQVLTSPFHIVRVPSHANVTFVRR